MGFLSRILGIEKLKEEIRSDRIELEILKESLTKKFENLVRFSRLSRNEEIMELRFAVKELDKRISKLEVDVSREESAPKSNAPENPPHASARDEECHEVNVNESS